MFKDIAESNTPALKTGNDDILSFVCFLKFQLWWRYHNPDLISAMLNIPLYRHALLRFVEL